MSNDKSLFNTFMSDYYRWIFIKRLKQIVKEMAPEIDVEYYAQLTPEQIATKFHASCVSDPPFAKGGITGRECRRGSYHNAKPTKLLDHFVVSKEDMSEFEKILFALDCKPDLVGREIRTQPNNNPKPHTTMTKEELIKYVGSLEKRLSVLRALANGKTIQYLSNSGWIDIDPNQQNISGVAVFVTDIRIKPEQHYRPYTAEEFDKALNNHSNFLREKTKTARKGIGWYDDTAVGFVTTSTIFETYYNLLDDYVWADDNTPCGVLTDEPEAPDQ